MGLDLASLEYFPQVPGVIACIAFLSVYGATSGAATLCGAAGPVQYLSQNRFGLKKNGLLLRSGAGEGSYEVSVTVLNTVLFVVVVVVMMWINLVLMLVTTLMAVLERVLINLLSTALVKRSGKHAAFRQCGWPLGGG